MERKTKVFSPFLYNMGIHNIKFNDPMHQFNVFLIQQLNTSVIDNISIKSTFKDLSIEHPVYVGKLKYDGIETVNNESKMYSEISYQDLQNIPASAYIFSEYDCPPNCFVRRDNNYVCYPYKVDDLNYYNFKVQHKNFTDEQIKSTDSYEVQMMKALGTYQEPIPEYINADEDPVGCIIAENDIFNDQNYDGPVVSAVGTRIIPCLGPSFFAEYWEDSYAFSEKYDSDEYDIYSLNQLILDENEIELKFDDLEKCVVDINETNTFGAILVTYHDNKYKNEELDTDILVSYVQLPFAIKIANQSSVNINWSVNGLIEAT